LKRMIFGALMATLFIFTTSCGFLPEEEVLPSAPVINPYEGDPFTTCLVERGNVVETKRVSCSYLAVKEETLRFTLGGEVIDEVFVQVGSIVKAGDVLAQLDMGTIDQEIESCKDNIELLEMQLSHGYTDRALAADRQSDYRATLTEEEKDGTQTVAEVTIGYDSQNQQIANNLAVYRMRLEELLEEQKERQIIATIDGAVTKIAPYESGDLSSKQQDFITVSDSSTSAFVGNAREKDLFKEGDEVVLVAKDTEYAATVVSPTVFGIEDAGKVDGYYYYYFKLVNPEYELEEGDTASISVVTREAVEVLWLPDTAINYKGDVPIVYYENEDGIRDIKEITIGLAADHRVEIVSGLAEGDSVIIE